MCALLSWGKAKGWVALPLLYFCTILPVIGDVTVQEACVQMTASYNYTPGASEIRLEWQADGNAREYEVARKGLGGNSWSVLATLPGNATAWIDANVQHGEAYEYRVIKKGLNGYDGFGYIAVGAGRFPVEQRGRVILIAAEHLAAELGPELALYRQDLVGDGWQVTQRNVSTNLSAPEVKEIIRAEYQRDPAGAKALVLFGHVAVPYSGNLMPDGHEDHRGAWPADVYYAEFDGAWTDTELVRTNGFNRNVPGDGRFDQSSPPGPVRLQVGRVDLSNLTCFANKTPPRYEVDLARQYLNKNHNFRHARLDARRRALVFDREYRGTELEPQTSMAYRSFPGFFGRDQIRILRQWEFFPLLANEPYLWSYVVSGGSQIHSDYVGTSDSFALNDPKVVFASFLGSYFGDWDRESNFLRAPLGTSSYTLVSMYGGQPAWLLHPMGVGETIGYSAMLTQNNRTNGLYVAHPNWGIGQVHIALMGDPTLRMHPVAPVRDLRVVFDESGARLTWSPSTDPTAGRVYVYKSQSLNGPFTRITSDSIVQGSFTDPSGREGDYYMARALKLESTPSGTYQNMSQGIFATVGAGGTETLEAPSSLGVINVSQGAVTLQWSQRGTPRAFQVQRRLARDGAFVTIGEADGTTVTYTDRLNTPGVYAYRVKALGFGTESDFSGEAVINLQTPFGRFVGSETTTGGDWRGRYGQDGYALPLIATNWPAYVSISSSNVFDFLVSADWPETNAPVRPDGSPGAAAYWYGQYYEVGYYQPMRFNFRFSDDTTRRVAFYLVQYGEGERTGRIDVTDPLSGRVMATSTYTNTPAGRYHVFDIRNYADVSIAPATGNAVVSGIFFATPVLAPPTIAPGSGTFPGRTSVSISSAAGTSVRFTLDGTDPHAGSALYTSPFVVTADVNVAARAFRDGYAPSEITRVSLTNSIVSVASFLGVDTTTQGEWQTAYGQAGWAAVGAGSPFVSEVEMNLGSNQQWIWTGAANERRALNVNRSGRLASCWYSESQCVFETSIFTDGLRPLSLYFMDWDRRGRVQDVIISDTMGRVLDQRRVENFGDGKHFVWNARGSLRITVRLVSGINAVLNGIFIGDPRAISAAPPALQSGGTLAGGMYTIRIAGEPGQTFVIQSSGDLRTWVDLERRTLSGNSLEYSIPFSPEAGLRVFRARLEQ